jgi:hypothetical protein
VADVLTGPFAVAAIVVAVAGISKLRAPAFATAALHTLGVAAPAAMVRLLGGVEVLLGAWCLLAPGVASSVALGSCYAAFAGVSLALARRRAACGCFGVSEHSASPAQVGISGVLAAVCFAAALAAPHGVVWVLGRPAGQAVVLLIGIAGCAYATVLAYTQLPAAWGAWSAR